MATRVGFDGSDPVMTTVSSSCGSKEKDSRRKEGEKVTDHHISIAPRRLLDHTWARSERRDVWGQSSWALRRDLCLPFFESSCYNNGKWATKEFRETFEGRLCADVFVQIFTVGIGGKVMYDIVR